MCFRKLEPKAWTFGHMSFERGRKDRLVNITRQRKKDAIKREGSPPIGPAGPAPVGAYALSGATPSDVQEFRSRQNLFAGRINEITSMLQQVHPPVLRLPRVPVPVPARRSRFACTQTMQQQRTMQRTLESFAARLQGHRPGPLPAGAKHATADAADTMMDLLSANSAGSSPGPLVERRPLHQLSNMDVQHLLATPSYCLPRCVLNKVTEDNLTGADLLSVTDDYLSSVCGMDILPKRTTLLTRIGKWKAKGVRIDLLPAKLSVRPPPGAAGRNQAVGAAAAAASYAAAAAAAGSGIPGAGSMAGAGLAAGSTLLGGPAARPAGAVQGTYQLLQPVHPVPPHLLPKQEPSGDC